MRIRGLIVASVAFLLLGGTLYWSEHHKPADEAAKPAVYTPPPVLKLEQTGITRLEFKRQGNAPIVLAKDNSGTWEILQPASYNADAATVSSAVSTLSSLNSERVIEDRTSDLKPYGLEQPALEVDITAKANKTQKLLLGDETPTGSAVYAALAGDPRVFTIASYHKSTLDKGVNDLRDKRLITVDTDKISRLELVRKRGTLEFGRDREAWQILKPRPLRADNFQVDELARKLTNARMNLSGSDKDLKQAVSAFAHATPVATATITGPSGTQELQVRKNNDTYYAKSSLVEGAYKVDSDLGQSLDKKLDDFRNKKLFDFGYSDPDKIEMHNGPKAYFLTKDGRDWWSSGKKMDAASVQSYISNLRDLAASKFVESGFTGPAMEVTVTSNDGKRVEKVSLTKSHNGYIAKRENDPTLYQLESSSVDALQKAADNLTPATTPGK
jgi:hypothetical protein